MLDLFTVNIIILFCSIIGLFYGLINAYLLSKIQVNKETFKEQLEQKDKDLAENIDVVIDTAGHIEIGAKAFLYAEYKVIAIFIVIMAIIIALFVETKIGEFWTTMAFITGAVTSLVSGYIGMRVAVFSNYRCAFKSVRSMADGFKVAYQTGCVMGFCLCSLGVLVLLLLITIYNNWYVEKFEDLEELYDKIAGYGLGGSTMALFGRVGGGIYTKAADVGSDLVGKVEKGLKEDSPYNPGTIADNVGDNVGDIAGMGADLFGSFSESTCAALVVCSTSPSFFFHPSAIYYPIMISALSLVACLFVSQIALNSNCDEYEKVQGALKGQLYWSTILLIPTLWLAGYLTLPDRIVGLAYTERTHWYAFYCCVFGLVSGLIIGLVTEFFTSKSQAPVIEIAAASTNPAINIILGLALGNYSVVIPVVCLAITAYFAHIFMGMFGVALAALGMLSNLSIGLAIDGYGPVSDNGGGIAEMCNLPEQTRKNTDNLDAAGNVTAAIGKGFAIGSAALVSLSLYGAFLTRSARPQNKHPITDVNISTPLVLSGIFIGAMLPYIFSAFCLKAVGQAAAQMVEEIRRQLRERPGIFENKEKPDYDKCISISTKYSLKEMLAPGILVLGTPFVLGIIVGPQVVAGLLPGALVSAVSMATSSANAGGAWDNAKKCIEAGELIVEGKPLLKYIDNIKDQPNPKHKPYHASAVTGDTIGDPFKDTSGPSLNILMKLMAIFSLVFQPFFDNTAWLQCFLAPLSGGCKA